jgi:hypothetical protein
MGRLYRPNIPVEVKARVLMRQLGELWPDEAIAAAKRGRSLGRHVDGLKKMLADPLGCEAKDLRLDHDPALAARGRKGEGRNTVYFPDANDPAFLVYREKHAHDIKTNVRGDGAQYPDRVLIKRERRRLKAKVKHRIRIKPPKKSKWPSRPLRSASRWPKGRRMR